MFDGDNFLKLKCSKTIIFEISSNVSNNLTVHNLLLKSGLPDRLKKVMDLN